MGLYHTRTRWGCITSVRDGAVSQAYEMGLYPQAYEMGLYTLKYWEKKAEADSHCQLAAFRLLQGGQAGGGRKPARVQHRGAGGSRMMDGTEQQGGACGPGAERQRGC